MISPFSMKGSVMTMNLSRSTRYFKSICQLVWDDRFGKSYRKMFEYLYSRDFEWSVMMDRNRALDGIDLRDKYGCSNDLLDEPCSVLEMLIALAARMENQIMSNFDEGDRTGQWFWLMINNLGLTRLDDDNFNEEIAGYFIDRFLNREYESDGSGGGLFVLDHPYQDLRDVEIWIQANWFLGEMDGYS